jgi:hypothetical protein
MRTRPHRLTDALDAGDGDALFDGRLATEGEVRVSTTDSDKDTTRRQAGAAHPTVVKGALDRDVGVAKCAEISNARKAGLKYQARVMGTPKRRLGHRYLRGNAQEVRVAWIECQMHV